MSETALDRFFTLERSIYGKADYYFKKDTKSSAVRAFYARPFCPEYAESFTTTLYPNTYFAGTKMCGTRGCLETEYHENIHKWDRWHEGFKFNLKYLWPHWMGLPFMLAAVVLGGVWSWVAFAAFVLVLHIGLGLLAFSAKREPDSVPAFGFQMLFYLLAGLGLLGLIAVNIWSAGWWALLWLGAALFFSPKPFKPIWRRNYEIRGYTMSLFRIWLKYRDRFSEDKFRKAIDHYVDTFAGPAYVFMETDKDWVRKEFMFQTARMQFSENGFLKNWIWKDSVTEPHPELAEPFRMAWFFIEREGFGG